MLKCNTTFLRRTIFAQSRPFLRSFSSSNEGKNQLVSHEIDTNTGVATLTMQNAPANALSLEMFHALIDSIQTIESDADTRAMVLQSSSPKIFSAGLDLRELYEPDPQRLETFWGAFQDLYYTLYGSRLATIASIHGHAPAAGCVLALCCDYRIMASDSNAKIGLNESQIGINIPPWIGQLMIDTIGRRKAEMSLCLGTLFSAKEAHQIQLVDALVELESVSRRAMEVAASWSKIPPTARVACKEIVRRPRINMFQADRAADTQAFVDCILHIDTQKTLGSYLTQIGKRQS